MAKLFDHLKRLANILDTLEYSTGSDKRGSAKSGNGVRQVRKKLAGYNLDIILTWQGQAGTKERPVQIFQITAKVEAIAPTANLQEMRVSLFAGNRELASFPLRGKQAVFDDVRPGRYVLRLERQRNEVGSVLLNLG